MEGPANYWLFLLVTHAFLAASLRLFRSAFCLLVTWAFLDARLRLAACARIVLHAFLAPSLVPGIVCSSC